MERAWIISTGTELTLGRSVDTNAAWLARHLAELGVRTERVVVLPDDADALRETLLQAAAACQLVLITGGLGPTEDDVTRRALAEAAGVPLTLDEPSLAHLCAYFAERGLEMPEANVSQAMIPQSGRALPNDRGTAPGVLVELGGTPCYAMPGVPYEMGAMFAAQVAPGVRAATTGRVLASRCLRTTGVPEARLGARIADLMAEGRNPCVGVTTKLSIINVTISATAASDAEARRLLDETEREIRSRLGVAVFGMENDTLASVVGELLASASLTLSTAESCTGGLIGKLLTDASGSSRYYFGGVVSYADEAKRDLLGVSAATLEQHGAVSERVADEMARGARRAFQSDYALSVTGVAGPTGGTAEKPVGLVYIGLAGPDRTSVSELRCGPQAPRDVIRTRSAVAALDRLRRTLLSAEGGQ